MRACSGSVTPGAGDLIVSRRLILTDWMDFENGWTCEFDELYYMIIIKFTSLLKKTNQLYDAEIWWYITCVCNTAR